MSREEDRFPCSVKTDTPVGSVEINGRVYRVALVVEELIQIQAARVAELEAELVAQWKWDDGSILRKRRIEKLIHAETLNA